MDQLGDMVEMLLRPHPRQASWTEIERRRGRFFLHLGYFCLMRQTFAKSSAKRLKKRYETLRISLVIFSLRSATLESLDC
jgi:hypothetical protein